MGALSLLSADQRRYDRSRCRIQVAVRTPLVSCDGLVARDISPEGIGVEPGEVSREAFLRLVRWGRRFTVKLRLPSGEVRARARLAWTGRAGAGWRAGLEFVRVGPRAREAIRGFVRELCVEKMIRDYADVEEKNLRRVFTG